MTSSLGPAGLVELAVVERSGMIESRHLGAAIVTGPAGEILVEHGHGDALVYPRSTLKLIQVVGMLSAGLDLDGEQLALASASHWGTSEHLRVVREILALAGLDESALQCPLDWPIDPAARRDATGPSRSAMCCSGKHAAMLLTCVRNGWSTEDYLDPGHPLQQLMRVTVEAFAEDPVEQVGVDGCGTPVFALTLTGLAVAIGKIGAGVDPHAARLTAAIKANSWALDTPTVARVIDDLDVIAKTGAEGVFVAASANGTSVALKVIDGSSRALVPVGLSLLAGVGAVDAERADLLVAQTTEPVTGRGEIVGELRSVV